MIRVLVRLGRKLGVGATVDPWSGLIAAIGQPTGAPTGAAVGAVVDRDLAWQTTVGQIIFL